MATYDQTRLYTNNCKKSQEISVGTLKPASEGTIVVADVIQLFKLPANAVVTNAYIVVTKAPTTGTQTLKVTVGTTDVIAAVAVGTAANAVKGGSVTKAYTGTGAIVSVTGGVADLTDGEFEVVVSYDEITEKTGELTNFIA